MSEWRSDVCSPDLRATPLRLIQVPLAPVDSGGPIFLTLIDEEFGPADRGTAQTYVETLLSLLPFGLAMVDRDGRFLYMNRAFARAAGLAEGRMPRYPGDQIGRTSCRERVFPYV